MDLPIELKRKYGEFASKGLFGPHLSLAIFTVAGLKPFQAEAHIYVGPDTNGWMWFTLGNAEAAAIKQILEHQIVEISVQGQLSDGSAYSIEKCVVSHAHTNSGPCHASFSGGKMTIRTPQFPTVKPTLLARSPVIVQRNTSTEGVNFRVSYCLINAIFVGEIESAKDDGRSRSSRRDRVQFKSTRYSWNLVWLEGFDEEQRDCLRSGLVSYLPTACLETTLTVVSEPQDFDDEAEAICRLLSLASGVATTWSARRVWQGEKLIQEWFERKCPPTTAEAKSRYELISNIDDLGALREFLEKTVSEYRRKESTWKLNEAIDYLELARSQKVVQLQLAVLVLALELISHQWCLQNGLTADQLAKMNIQQKLGRMKGKEFRFIERCFIEDALRADIRNPLLHSGQIPNMQFREMTAWSNALYDLAVRIIFYVLGFEGRYRNLTKSLAITDAPKRDTTT